MNKTLRIALALILSLALCVGGASLALASQPSSGNVIGGNVDGTLDDNDQTTEEGSTGNNGNNNNPNEGENADGEGSGDAQEEKPFTGPTITFEDRKIAVSQGSAYHKTDLFGGFKDVMPGDNLYQTITFTNNGSATVKVYLQAVPHDANNDLSYNDPSGERRETVASMREFLSMLTIEIFGTDTEGNDRLLYTSKGGQPSEGDAETPEGDSNDQSPDNQGKEESSQDQQTGGSENRASNARSLSSSGDDLALLSADGEIALLSDDPDDGISLLASEGGDDDPVFLLTLPPGKSGTLKIKLSVPIELGDKYADRVGEVDWLFTFQEEGGIGGGDPDDPSDPDDPDDPSDPDNPDDPGGPDGPLGPLPITGDNAPVMLAFCGLILATILLAFAVIMKRRDNRK